LKNGNKKQNKNKINKGNNKSLGEIDQLDIVGRKEPIENVHNTV